MYSQAIKGCEFYPRDRQRGSSRVQLRKSTHGFVATPTRACTATSVANATATTQKHVPEPTVGKAPAVKPAEYNYTKQMKPGNQSETVACHGHKEGLCIGVRLCVERHGVMCRALQNDHGFGAHEPS